MAVRNLVLMATLSVVSGEGGGGASHFVIPPGDPTADPAAVVLAGGARFTVLADAVVRMEWKVPGDGWNDMQTMVVFNRRTRVPQFTHTPLPNGGKQVHDACVVTSSSSCPLELHTVIAAADQGYFQLPMAAYMLAMGACAWQSKCAAQFRSSRTHHFQIAKWR
jgi:hypothetical protein